MTTGNLIGTLEKSLFFMIPLVVLCLTIGGSRTLRGQDASSFVDSDASRHSHLLTWEFVPGEVMRVKTVFDYETETNKSQRTESIYDYRWKVEEVDRDGTATVLLQFDRVRLRYTENDSVFEFDSSEPGSETLTQDSPAIGVQLAKSQEMLQSEYRIRVTARGKVTDLARSESDSKPAPRLFTPATWPILPATRVSQGDVWSKQLETDASKQYRLAKVEGVIDRVLHHIVSDGEVSIFDAEAGKFTEQAVKSRYQFKTSAGGLGKQSFSIRHRLFLSDSREHLGNRPMVQISKPTDTWNYLQLSYRSLGEMEEHLLGERDWVATIINRLFSQIISSDDLVEPSDDWEADRWMLAAQVYEREGLRDQSTSALHSAASSARSIEEGFYQAIELVKIANGLARLGDYPAAIEAARAIKPSTGVEGAHITAQGPVEVREGAIQSYALLLIIAKQAEAAEIEQSLATARRIPERNAKSAALWVIAMRQAEKGDLQGASETMKLAESSGPSPLPFQEEIAPAVLEVTTTGPRAAQFIAFRTLALSRIASKQALDGDDKGALKTLSQIELPILRNAATVELILSLTEYGRNDSVDDWMNKISDPAFRSIAQYNRGLYQLRLGEFERVNELALSIDDESFAVRLRFDLADRFSDEGERQQSDAQISLAQQLIPSIIMPGTKAEAMYQLALRQIDAGHREAATESLRRSQRLIEESISDEMAKAKSLGDIAVALNSAGEKQQAENMLKSLIQDAGQTDEFNRGPILLSLVGKQMAMGLEQVAQKQAGSIADAAERCQALASLGRSYGELLELDKSREMFAEAFEAAQQVDDLLGLDTPYSKGGAIRLTAREQANCDRDGLVEYRSKVMAGGEIAITPLKKTLSRGKT